MTFQQDTWAVDGAPVSGNLMRLLARFLSNHQSGIVLPGDLEVRELATPGSSVRILDGECVILGDAVPDLGTYYGYNVGQEEVAIAPTDSSGGRSDLVAIQAHDPTYTGSQFQGTVNPRTDRIIFPEVFQNVDSEGVLQGEYNFVNVVPLAVIDIPASTSTITQDMIIDHREVAVPLTRPYQDSVDHFDTNEDLTTLGTWTNFPGDGNTSVRVPSWANVMDVNLTIRAMTTHNPNNAVHNMFGRTRFTVNGIAHGESNWNQDWNYINDSIITGHARTVSNISSLQGNTITLQAEHIIDNRDASGTILRAHGGTSTIWSVFFRQSPVANP